MATMRNIYAELTTSSVNVFGARTRGLTIRVIDNLQGDSKCFPFAVEIRTATNTRYTTIDVYNTKSQACEKAACEFATRTA